MIYCLLIIFLFVAFWQVNLIVAQFWGAPSVYANKGAISDTISLAKPQKKELIVDMGCGDGRSLVFAARKFDLNGVGIERSLYCFLLAKILVWLSGENKRVKILFGDFKKAENYLQKADIVYLYLLNIVLERNEAWFFSNIKDDARIVSLSFGFKKHTPQETINTKNLGKKTTAFLYKKN